MTDDPTRERALDAGACLMGVAGFTGLGLIATGRFHGAAQAAWGVTMLAAGGLTLYARWWPEEQPEVRTDGGQTEDDSAANRALCDGCGERVASHVLRAGGAVSGDYRTARGVQGVDIAWCAWDAAGVPEDARPVGWRSMRPSEGFPCPDCGSELTGDALEYGWTDDYEKVARCPECSGLLRGE